MSNSRYFSSETMDSKREEDAKQNKTCQPRIQYMCKLYYTSEGEIKASLDKRKLKMFIDTRPVLEEILNFF